MFHYTAETRRHELTTRITKASFFSLLLDGSTDKDNIDNQLILVVWCHVNGSDEQVHTRMDYLTIVRPQSVSDEGLFNVLEMGLQSLGIDRITADKCKMVVGIGTEGASANTAASGLKSCIEATYVGFSGSGVWLIT